MSMYRLLLVITNLVLLAHAGCAQQEGFEELPPLAPSLPKQSRKPYGSEKPISSEHKQTRPVRQSISRRLLF